MTGSICAVLLAAGGTLWLAGSHQGLISEALGADLNLNACWPFGDALVDVPGYDVRILPPSGVMQSAAYWMLQAEVLRHRP